MRRLFLSVMAVVMVSAFIATPRADAQQSVNFYIGGFTPRGEGSRDVNDVLFQNQGFLAFDMHQFDGVTVGGEWVFPLADFVDAGLGIGYYSHTVHSVYTHLVNSDGSEIQQDLSLRFVPFTATVRVLPFGHHSPIVPYVGGGVGVYYWRYNESGDFVDNADNSIFYGNFTGSGSAVGPVVLGGVTVPLGAFGFGGEVRWQGGEGTLPANQGFAGSKIDLSGVNYLVTFSMRF